MKKLLCVVAVAACCGCALWTGMSEPGSVAVNAYDFSGVSTGAGVKAEKRGKGFVVHAESALAFKMNGKVKAFDAMLSVDPVADKAKKLKRPIKMVCKVWADGKIVWKSAEFNEKMKPFPVHVDLTGKRDVIIETSSSGLWTAFDAACALWDDAKFTYDKGATIEAVTDDSATAQLGILTPPEKPEPQFNGAEVWGVRPGHEVIYRVPVSGVRPMKFSVAGLPEGVTFDEKYGVLRGTAPAKAGDYPIVVTAKNAKGQASRTITLKVGDTICLTPPMGWNSWNVWCYRLTAEHAMASALALENSGLGNHGWAYVNLDDWWQMNNTGKPRVAERQKDFGREDVIGPARDAKGKIIPNRSFPDMKKLADYIHSFGFKAGLYSSPGTMTCGGCEGSYQHEMQDAESWAEWGFDYVKYDWCSYGMVFKKLTKDRKATWEDYAKPYILMDKCLKAQKRDIVYSYCQYGMGDVQDWARKYGANCWRSWDDLKDTWPWMELALDSRINGEFWKYNGPGCWADPDMMIIGQQYSFGSDHPTFLTPNEQYSHVSLWCMVGSPLLIGCDLTKIDAFTRNLLANDEVIAISQDTLGKVAKREIHDDCQSVWVRPLANGDKAVAIVSRYPVRHEFTIDLRKLGIEGKYKVRDCWRQKDEGTACGRYTVELPSHATHLIRLKPIACARCD